MCILSEKGIPYDNFKALIYGDRCFQIVFQLYSMLNNDLAYSGTLHSLSPKWLHPEKSAVSFEQSSSTVICDVCICLHACKTNFIKIRPTKALAIAFHNDRFFLLPQHFFSRLNISERYSSRPLCQFFRDTLFIFTSHTPTHTPFIHRCMYMCFLSYT